MENEMMMEDTSKPEGSKMSLEETIELMYQDYKNDKELTVFTEIDSEPFMKSEDLIMHI